MKERFTYYIVLAGKKEKKEKKKKEKRMEEKRREWRCWFSYLSGKTRWKATSTTWLFLDVLKCHVEGENVMSETIRRYCRKEDVRNTIFFLSTSVKRMYAYVYIRI